MKTIKRVLIAFVIIAILLFTAAAVEPAQGTTNNTNPEEITITDLKTGKETNVHAQENKDVMERPDDFDSNKLLRSWLNTIDHSWRVATRPRWKRLINDLFEDFDDTWDRMWPSQRQSSLPSLFKRMFDDEDWFGRPIARDVDNLWERFSKTLSEFKHRERDEWKENPDAFVLKIYAPRGMDKKDLKVEVEKRNDKRYVMTIRGKKELHEKSEAPEKTTPTVEEKNTQDVTKTAESQELSTSHAAFKQFDQIEEFERRYIVPETVDVHKISASMKDSSLVITLPKKPEAVQQRINVNVM